jgi:glycerol uptake facilitator-like aquaporin
MKKLLLPLKFGLITGGVLIAYFIVLSLFGKHINPAFSLLNAGITLLGIYEAVRYNKQHHYIDFTYVEGFKIGIATGFISTLLFTAFFLLYATEINPYFLEALLDNMHWGFKSHIGLITFIVAIMGFCTSLVSALTVMQLFKNSNNYVEN